MTNPSESKDELQEYLRVLQKNQPVRSGTLNAITAFSVFALAIFVIGSFYVANQKIKEMRLQIEQANTTNDDLTEKLFASSAQMTEISKIIDQFRSELGTATQEMRSDVKTLEYGIDEINSTISAFDYAGKGDVEALSDLFKDVHSLQAGNDELSESLELNQIALVEIQQRLSQVSENTRSLERLREKPVLSIVYDGPKERAKNAVKERYGCEFASILDQDDLASGSAPYVIFCAEHDAYAEDGGL